MKKSIRIAILSLGISTSAAGQSGQTGQADKKKLEPQPTKDDDRQEVHEFETTRPDHQEKKPADAKQNPPSLDGSDRKPETAPPGETPSNVGAKTLPSDAQGVKLREDKFADIRLMAEIRREMMKQKSLSMSARNIRVLVSRGAVTLNGAVADENEKQLIENIAQEKAGKANVRSNLNLARKP